MEKARKEMNQSRRLALVALAFGSRELAKEAVSEYNNLKKSFLNLQRRINTPCFVKCDVCGSVIYEGRLISDEKFAELMAGKKRKHYFSDTTLSYTCAKDFHGEEVARMLMPGLRYTNCKTGEPNPEYGAKKPFK